MKNIFNYIILSTVLTTSLAQAQSVNLISDSNRKVPSWLTEWFLGKKKSIPLTMKADYQIEGLIGAYPTKIYWIIDQLKQKESPLLSNRLILYGPPGNGKSTLARALARKANCDILSLNGPSVVGSYLGEGSQKIRELFEAAAEKYEKSGKKVVIFIDEIDAICRANINYEAAARAEHQVATQELWLQLDKYKHHPGIFFICATNHFDKLDRTFLDRFNTNTLEIPNPDAPARRNVLLHYLAKHKLSFEESLLSALVKNSEGLSVRTLEDLVQDVAISILIYGPDQVSDENVWELLRATKKKFAQSGTTPKKTWREFFSLSTQDILTFSHYALTLPISAFQLYSILKPKESVPSILPGTSSLIPAATPALTDDALYA